MPSNELRPRDLVYRVRVLIGTGTPLAAAIEEVIETLCADPADCRAALRCLGPIALRVLEQRSIRTSNGQGHLAVATHSRNADPVTPDGSDHVTTDTHAEHVGATPITPGQTRNDTHLNIAGQPITASHYIGDTHAKGAGQHTNPDHGGDVTLPNSVGVSAVRGDGQRGSDTHHSVAVSAYPAVPVTNRYNRKGIREWTADDLQSHIDLYRAFYKTLKRRVDVFERVKRLLKKDETVGQAWDRIRDDDRAVLARFGGIKLLAG